MNPLSQFGVPVGKSQVVTVLHFVLVIPQFYFCLSGFLNMHMIWTFLEKK
jgi:hypothetical protein